MGFWGKLFGGKSDHSEDRRQYLLRFGRITDGIILDSFVDDNGNEIASYLFTLNGVDFESSDVLTIEQRNQPAKYAPGAKVGIRYDPRNQGNCILE